MVQDPSREELRHQIEMLEQKIADQKKSSELLQNELKNEVIRRRILVEQSRDGIVVVDQHGKVDETNRQFAHMLGYPIAEMYQLHVWDWDTQWSREQLLEMLREINDAGDHFETRHRRKDGTCFDVEISTNGATFEDRKLVFCVCRDITARKQAEEALKESEERFRKLFQDAPIAIQGYLPDGTVWYWNQASTETYQYTRKEAINRNLMDLIIPPEMREQFAATMDRVAETGELQPQEERLLMRKNGSRVPVLTSQVAIKRGIRAKELFCIGMDLTELKRLQTELQQAHKMEAIGTLTGGIAHDFNNILGIILGNCELALDDVPLSHPARDCLEEIKTASLRAKGIVQQLVSYCLKTNQIRKPIRLIPVLDDTIKFIRATIPTTIDIRLYVQAADDVILSDPNLIYQIMMNLCSNALHAMEKTGGTIIINVDNIDIDPAQGEASQDMPPGAYIRLSVNDTGSGISPDTIDMIFDPYFTTKEAGKGSGMGLAVVKGIINKHDGKISVKSDPRTGTTFTILLPLVEIGPSPASDTHEKDVMLSGSETVMYVDDELPIVAMGRKILERLGYTVITSTSPLKVLKHFKENPNCCDLLITDMTMPLMTGAQLTRKLRKLNPHIPIILCTGFSEHITPEKAEALGISGLLMKPVLKDEMARVVRSRLDRNR